MRVSSRVIGDPRAGVWVVSLYQADFSGSATAHSHAEARMLELP